jgi:dTDP-4-amino-4,6-dideoxygalactose transaminase
VRFAGSDQVVLKVLRMLRDAGYEVGRSFEPLHLQGAYRKYARAAMPRAEAAWRSLVELPCEPSVKIEDIRRIAGLVRVAAGAT